MTRPLIPAFTEEGLLYPGEPTTLQDGQRIFGGTTPRRRRRVLNTSCSSFRKATTSGTDHIGDGQITAPLIAKCRNDFRKPHSIPVA